MRPAVAPSSGPASRRAIFFNPAMADDRDRNVAVVRAARAMGLRLVRGWEMLAATGVRGLRLVREAGPFERFRFTEGQPAAFSVLEENARGAAAGVAEAIRGDPRTVTAPGGGFDYVDLDPYGSPIPFLDAALDATAPDGLLAVTATDTRVLAGVDRGAAERRYGGRPVRGRLGPEGGLRLLLAELSRRVTARGRSLVPRVAYVGSHHLRCYVSFGPPTDSPPVALIDPASWTGPPLPGDGPFGPFWLGPLFDRAWVERMTVADTAAEPRRLGRWVEQLRAEASVDRPFYYEGNSLAQRLALDRPPSVAAMTLALAARGFRCAPTHARAGAFRTDAMDADVVAAARAAGGQLQNDRVRA